MPKIISRFGMAMVLFTLTACQTTSKKEKPIELIHQTQQGTFETKVQMKDFKKNKTYYFDIDFIAENKKALRAEVSAGFGTAVATLGLKGNDMILLVHTEKKAYVGKVTKQSLSPMVGFDLDPNIFYSVLFDEKNTSPELEVKITSKKDDRKRVMVSRANHFEMEFYFKDSSTKVQEKPDLYTPKIPDSYERHKI